LNQLWPAPRAQPVPRPRLRVRRSDGAIIEVVQAGALD